MVGQIIREDLGRGFKIEKTPSGRGPRDINKGTDQMQSKGREVGWKGTSGL